jgi:hypothetical protein
MASRIALLVLPAKKPHTSRLKMGAREFWRVVKGRTLIELPPVWVEVSLFDMMEDDDD